MNKLSETFSELRQANVRRLPLFKNKHGEPAHFQADGSDWNNAEWFEAIVGELGEYANVRKKLRRGDYTEAEALPMMADELADVATYLDIFAFRLGIDLGTMLKLNYTPQHGKHSVLSDAEWLSLIVSHLGHWVDTQERTDIVQIAMHLAALAARQGIDLSDAIVSKFNRVSERVGCDVRMVGAA